MLKKRYLHRNDWTRIIQRDYSILYSNENDFKGFIALIKMNEVTKPLITEYLNKNNRSLMKEIKDEKLLLELSKKFIVNLRNA